MFLFAYFAGGQDFGDYFRLKWKDRRYDNRSEVIETFEQWQRQGVTSFGN